jgi:hypothetical protein
MIEPCWQKHAGKPCNLAFKSSVIMKISEAAEMLFKICKIACYLDGKIFIPSSDFVSYEPIPSKQSLCLTSDLLDLNTANRHIRSPFAAESSRMQSCIKSAEFRSKDYRDPSLPSFDIFG